MRAAHRHWTRRGRLALPLAIILLSGPALLSACESSTNRDTEFDTLQCARAGVPGGTGEDDCDNLSTPPPPPPISPASALPSNSTDSGAKAAGLLTAAQLSAATGTPFGAPQPNGGKAHYTPTILASNATAMSTSGQYRLDYTVYLGTPDAVSGFWKTETASKTDPPIPGPWTGAFFWSTIQTFYGYSPGGAYEIKLIDTKATTYPDQKALAAESAHTADVAKALNASLNP